METPVMREEIQTCLQAWIAFMEFARHNELTPAERNAIGHLPLVLGLDLYSTPSPDDSPLAETLSNMPPID
jgi:hypothetical protein